ARLLHAEMSLQPLHRCPCCPAECVRVRVQAQAVGVPQPDEGLIELANVGPGESGRRGALCQTPVHWRRPVKQHDGLLVYFKKDLALLDHRANLWKGSDHACAMANNTVATGIVNPAVQLCA